jgi:hypothetical protein
MIATAVLFVLRSEIAEERNESENTFAAPSSPFGPSANRSLNVPWLISQLEVDVVPNCPLGPSP